MERYLDEQTFRCNYRIGHADGSRFQKALAKVRLWKRTGYSYGPEFQYSVDTRGVPLLIRARFTPSLFSVVAIYRQPFLLDASHACAR